jgi:nitrile hydratase
MSPLEFTVLENTSNVHNVIVCTLCSCYPRTLLGMSPAWYKSKNYRSRIVREPRVVLQEFGVNLSDDVEVRVHDSTAELRYMVLPQRPEGTDDWPEEKLAGLVTRDSLIGTQRDLARDG